MMTAGALPVFAEELDAAEAYNQKWLTATGYCISLCFFPCGYHYLSRQETCREQVAELSGLVIFFSM